MKVYVILKNMETGENELERFNSDYWELRKKFISPERIIYCTCDIEDDELKDFKEIIWYRVYNRPKNTYERVFIPFDPTNVEEMRRAGKEKLEIRTTELKKETEQFLKEIRLRKIEKEKRQKASPEYQNYVKQKEENNKLIESNLSETEAIYKWKELDFITPPPLRIQEIRKTYNMTWSKFKKHILDNF